jgi:hypothetical protein
MLRSFNFPFVAIFGVESKPCGVFVRSKQVLNKKKRRAQSEKTGEREEWGS